MATHDYIIANASGAAFRTDLNNALAAIVSNNSNSSSPATTYAYQWWADTTNGVLKIRNSANNAWIELLQLDGTLTLEDGSVSTPALAFRDDLNTGIFSSAADTFNVATGGVERMELGATTIFNEDGADVDFRIEGDTESNLFYVDAGNDRIGIGSSSPQSILHIESSSNFVDIALRNSTSGSSGSDGADIFFNNNLELAFFNREAGPIRFATSGTERMRLDSSGDLFIGASSFSSGAKVIQFEVNPNTISLRSSAAITSLQFHQEFHNSNGLIGSISTNGSATSFTTSSDYRLKENVIAISDGITRLKTLKPSRFNFIADATKTVDGFLAHEVTAVPEAIIGTKDEVDADNNPVYQGIDQSKLVPLLTAALQETVTKIETLETKVAALEAA